MKTKMIKDGGVKFVDNKDVKELLLEEGWKVDEPKKAPVKKKAKK